MTDQAPPPDRPLPFAGVSRRTAASVHLGISALIGLALLAAMLLVWYPGEYFRLAGGSTLILILVGVDVTLGPLLTFVVFDPRKRLLRLDLAIIATLQLAALVYGAWVMCVARPVYLVFVVDQLIVVTAIELTPQHLAEAPLPQYRRLPLTGPELVGARLPTDPAERSALVMSAFAGTDLQHLPRYWEPIGAFRAELLVRAKPPAWYRERFAEDGPLLDAALARLGRGADQVLVIGVRGPEGLGLMLLDARDATPLALLSGTW